MRYVGLLAAAFLVVPSAAASQATPGDKAGTQAPHQEITVTGKQKKVCVQIVSTGSIMPKTTCRTQEEWDEAKAGSLRSLQLLKDARQNRTSTQTLVEGMLSGN